MTGSCCFPFIQLWNFHRMLTTDIHQIDLWRRQRTNRVCYIWFYVFFLFPDIYNFFFFFFFQSIVRNEINGRCRLFNSDFIYFSLSLFLFSPLKQRWAEHTSFTSLTRQTLHHHHLHKYIYTTADPIHIDSCMYIFLGEKQRKRERKLRDYNLAKEIFSVTRI